MEKMARFFSLETSRHGWLMNISSLLAKIFSFFAQNKLLLGTLLLAAYLRLFRISDYMTFLGDEGRDVLVVKGILEGDLTLLGPRASAGDFFTGPIYYYFMAPFLWLFRYDPVGPAVMIALLGVLTVFLVYLLGKSIFGRTAGLIAAVLYTISPIVIAYSRSSWNPNPMPFFSIVSIFLLYHAMKKRSIVLFLLSGILFGVMLQLHYIELFFGAMIFFFVVVGNVLFTKKHRILSIIKQSLVFFGGFLLGFSPFLAFEVRHGFPNFRTILGFILDQESTGDTVERPFFQTIWNVFFRLFGRLITRFPPPEQINTTENVELFIWSFATILLAIAAVYALVKVKDSLWRLLLGGWLGIGILLFGFYQKPIYDYYFEFLFPLPFLLVGGLLKKTSTKIIIGMVAWYIFSAFVLFHTQILPTEFSWVVFIVPLPIFIYSFLPFWEDKKELAIFAGSSIAFAGLVMINLFGYPFQHEPNKQKDQVRLISEFVLEKTNGQAFNFALLTPGNSDHGYRYFFDINNQNPVTIENEIIDPDRSSVTNQLFVVCEDTGCQPLGNSLWEIAGFGRAEIEEEWKVSVVKVYKLVPYEE